LTCIESGIRIKQLPQIP